MIKQDAFEWICSPPKARARFSDVWTDMAAKGKVPTNPICLATLIGREVCRLLTCCVLLGVVTLRCFRRLLNHQ